MGHHQVTHRLTPHRHDLPLLLLNAWIHGQENHGGLECYVDT